jgi:ATP-dependent DNA helicase RecQ
MPTITYTTWREEGDKLVIGEDVYEKRKEQYKNRIYAMIEYASNDYTCRSRMLLRYFGEKNIHDCGQCDACNNHNGDRLSESEADDVKKRILSVLADGSHHPFSDLLSLHLPDRIINETIEYLIDEEIIRTEDGMLYKD